MMKLLTKTLAAIGFGVLLSGALNMPANASGLINSAQAQQTEAKASPFWTRQPAPQQLKLNAKPQQSKSLASPSMTPALVNTTTTTGAGPVCCRIKLIPRGSFGYNPVMGNYLQVGTYIAKGDYDHYSGYSVSYSVGEFAKKINLSRSMGSRFGGSNIGIFYLTQTDSTYYSEFTQASGIELSFRLNQTILTSALAQGDVGDSFLILGIGFGY